MNWGEKLPLLYKSYTEGVVNRYDATGEPTELNEDQKKEIERLKVEFPELTVVAVLDKIYDFSGLIPSMHIMDFILIGEEEKPILGTLGSVCFLSYAKNLTFEECSELGDIGVQLVNGVLKRVY